MAPVLACFTAVASASLTRAAVVGFWEFSGITETQWLADSSGNGYNLTKSGAGTGFTVVSDETLPGGFNDSAAWMNSSSGNVQRFTVVDSAAFNTQTMTLEATINLTNATAFTPIIGQGLNTSTGWGLMVTRTGGNPSQTLVFQYSSGGVTYTLNSGIKIELANTYYVAAAIDLTQTSANGGSGATFYVQNLSSGSELVSASVSVTTAGLTDSTEALAIGFQQSSGQYKGYIDDVRFSNTVLPQSQLLIAVPEPATLALFFGMAVFAVGLFRRRST